MRESKRFADAMRSVVKLLTFRLGADGFARLDWRHLVVGLFLTWIVGMERWWDDPGAHVMQHLGVGSVIYIFILSAILWFFIFLLRRWNVSYLNVLTFVSMTSLPAILSAIPVERFLTLEGAQMANLAFLAVVALWRVALLAYFLRVRVGLGPLENIVTMLLPMTAIVVTLTVLNLERATFDAMGGFREQRTSNDEAYAVLGLLTIFAILMFIPLILTYAVLVGLARGRSSESDEGA